MLWDTAHVAPAFDLTIDGIHTYHVTAGAESVLVHNTCGSTNFPDQTFLFPDEIVTANRLIELESFEGIELLDFEAEFGVNTFDYVDSRGRLYDQIGGRTEISDDWLELDGNGRVTRDSFRDSLMRHFTRDFEGELGTVVVDLTGWSDVSKADIFGFLNEFGVPDRTIVLQ